MWFRGILPDKFTQIPSEHNPTELLVVKYANEHNIKWDSKIYYGDASGGSLTKYPNLRRVGCAVTHVLDNEPVMLGLRSTSLAVYRL